MPKKRQPQELPIHLQYAEKPSADDDQIEFIVRKQKAWNERHRSLIDAAEAQFKEDGNPLHAWDIFLLCRRDKWPIPEWVFQYLEESAYRMMNYKNVSSDLPEVFGFSTPRNPNEGGKTKWEQYKNYVIRREAKAHVETYLHEHPENPNVSDACAYAGSKMEGRFDFALKDPIGTIKKYLYPKKEK